VNGVEREVHEGIRSELLEQVGRHRFRLWFRDAVVSRVAGDEVTLAVPTEVHRTWLEYTYGEALRRACARILGDGVRIRVDVSPEEEGRRRVREELPGLPEEWDALLERRRPEPSFDAYVCPPGEPFGVRLLEQLVHGSGREDPPSVFLYGDPGAGKTHLLRSLANAVDRQQPGDAVYLTGRKFTSLFVAALRTKQVEAVRAFEVDLAHRRLVILDGLDALAGRRASEAELVTLRERALGTRTRFVLAGRRHPRDLEDLSPKLRSWILGGVVLRLPAATPDGLRRILEARALQFGVALPADVRDAIVARAGSTDAAVSTLERWAAASAELGRPLEASWLDEIAPCGASSARDEIVRRAKDAAARHYGVPRALLDRATKVRHAALARRIAMYLAYRSAALPLTELGNAFGLRSHSSVSRALQDVREARERDPDLEQVVDGLLARM
jgi:chromosomal replication initiator protein